MRVLLIRSCVDKIYTKDNYHVCYTQHSYVTPFLSLGEKIMQKDTGSLARPKSSGKQSEELFFQVYKKSFLTAVKWNIFESIAYQLIFIAHQVALFFYCDRSLYGKIGVLISCSYLCITLLVAGLDGGLLPFFKNFISDKRSFYVLLFTYIRKQIFFIIGITFLGMSIIIAFRAIPTFTPGILFLTALFIIAESIKKLLKQLLYLAFYNRYTALIEVAQIALYTGSIWVSFWSIGSFSLKIFLVPFIVCSSLSNIAFGYLLFLYYQTLPLETSFQELPTPKVFFLTRLAVVTNQLCRSLFTTNFLVPLFSLHGTFKEAGVMTFVNYLTHAVTFLLNKICVPPSEAFFSRIKNFSNALHYQALSIVLSLFAGITFVLGLLIFLKGKSYALLLGYEGCTGLTWNLILLFLFIHLLENIFIIYEKFFLLQGQVSLLALGNLLTCALCLLLGKLSFSFFTLIFLCIFIRFLFFFILSLVIARSK